LSKRGASAAAARTARRARDGQLLDSAGAGGEECAAMIVFVYGYEGSGEGHWQRWAADVLAREGAAVAFPELSDPGAPTKDAWVRELHAVVGAAVGRGERVTFLCHSLGCWAVDHLLTEHGTTGVHAALLVAPPSPYLLFEPVESFLPPPRRADVWAPLAARTLIVGSDNDDYASSEELEEVARRMGVGYRLLPGAGHINVAAGYGPWPLVPEWVRSVGA
jgi:predicted alpha/beta hydrolase family esterase